MDGRIKQSAHWSAEAKPGQLCCLSLYSSCTFFFSPHLSIASRVILISLSQRVISVWILGQWRGEGEVAGQQGVPADKDALRRWWVTQSAELISLPAKGVPLYLCFLLHCSHIAPSLVYFFSVSPYPSSRSLWSANNTTPDQDANRSEAQRL